MKLATTAVSTKMCIPSTYLPTELSAVRKIWLNLLCQDSSNAKTIQLTVPLLSQDFVFGLSIILRGTINDRLNWAFNLYDLNKDGCITKEVTHTHVTLVTLFFGCSELPALMASKQGRSYQWGLERHVLGMYRDVKGFGNLLLCINFNLGGNRVRELAESYWSLASSTLLCQLCQTYSIYLYNQDISYFWV